ncbi:tyrosine-type recombinase/integrase [Thermodesulfobacteriota bacterium]
MLKVPVEEASPKTISDYIEFLLDKGLKPKTINCHLDSIRGFYHYLRGEEDIEIVNPVKRGYALKLPGPLPRYLKDDEVERFLSIPKKARDNAMFYQMLRCGLSVEEVADLTLSDIDFRLGKILVQNGKGSKDRVVYISKDAYHALLKYLKVRRLEKAKRIFLVEKGTFKGKPISVRGIQKRMEYYAKKASIKMSCHQLRHTMATQMLNADAELVTIQDLLGHSRIKTTQQYSKVSNLKVQRDYYKAMEIILQRTT